MAFEISPLSHAIELLETFGFFQVVLPLILVFAVVYGILEKTEIFGEGKSNINAVIAFAIAFFTITSTDVVESMNNFIPQGSMLLVVALMGLLLLAFFGFDPQTKFGETSKWTALAALIIIVIFLGVVDASFGIRIPGIHEAVEAVTDSDDGGTGEPAGESWFETEDFQMAMSLALLFGLPLLVVLYIIKKPSKSS